MPTPITYVLLLTACLRCSRLPLHGREYVSDDAEKALDEQRLELLAGEPAALEPLDARRLGEPGVGADRRAQVRRCARRLVGLERLDQPVDRALARLVEDRLDLGVAAEPARPDRRQPRAAVVLEHLHPPLDALAEHDVDPASGGLQRERDSSASASASGRPRGRARAWSRSSDAAARGRPRPPWRSRVVDTAA